jgi:hypothetical protein
MLKIGLSGKMASGKCLVAEYLCNRYQFTELAFAARLKEIATEMFGFDVAKKDERGRYVLQQFAVHMREIDPLVWVRYVLRRIPEKGNVVISDVRFANEFDTLKSLGFTMVRMTMSRATQERIVRVHYPGLPLVMLDDYSERAVDNKPFDYAIDNDTGVTMEQVYMQVDGIIERLLLKEGKHGH